MNTPDLPTEPMPAATKRSTKRTAVLGTVAGVLGGGAIGLMMVAPSLTSAAATTDIPAVVALQDTEQDDTATIDESVRPEQGENLRAVLQSLVDDGTITSDQADAVAAHLIANRPERSGPGGREGRGGPGGMERGPGRDGEVVADLLGIDAQELRDELRSGSSIADIATANGVDVQTVIDTLVTEAQEHLDLAIENGRLTAAEAATKLDDLNERITARVNGERPARPAVEDADTTG